MEIPNSIESIGNDTFCNCSELTSVVIPNSVTSIGDYSFYLCNGLTSVVIPISVKSIGKSAFGKCSGMKEVNFNAENCISCGSNENPAFPSSIETLHLGDAVINIPEYAFCQCSGLKSVEIPKSVKYIDDFAFYGCNGLKVVIFNAQNPFSCGDYNKPAFPSTIETLLIGNAVNRIPKYAFSNCSGLKSVIIPNSVTSIGEDAFSGCSGLIKTAYPNTIRNPFPSKLDEHTCISYPADGAIIADGWVWGPDKCAIYFAPLSLEGEFVIPNSVTSIGDASFYECSYLTSVVFPISVISIGSEAFYKCTGLKSVIIPNSVTSIGDCAFTHCMNVTSVVIGNSVTLIGRRAFAACSGLTSIEIPNSVTSIDERAFEGCSGLTSVHIGNSVTTIESYAFSRCSSLTSVNIPNSVTTIGKGAYFFCSGLTSVILGNSVTSIGEDAFSGCSGLIKSAYPNTIRNPFPSKLDEYISIPYPAEDALIIDGWIWSPDKSVIYFAPLSLEGDYIIPKSVTFIGKSAFSGCSLTSIEIPNSVTVIEDEAFRICSSLTKATFASIESLCNIDFGGYSANPLSVAHHLYINGEEVTEVVIPESVTSIGENAFNGCSDLSSVVIPNSVTSIGNSTFYNCTCLHTIYSTNETPPTCFNNSFENVPVDAMVYVPHGSITKYSESEGWNRFSNFVETDNFPNAIESISVDSGSDRKNIFNMHGVCLKRNATQADIDALAPGLYIISGKKVVVK